MEKIIDYERAWKILEGLVAEKISIAEKEDDIETSNGGFGGTALRYKEFKEMMDRAKKF